MTNMDDNSDIINLTHPEPYTRQRMSMHQRVAQFAPFAALTGYNEAIEEEATQMAREEI